MAFTHEADTVLAGDVGGTKTDLAIFSMGSGRPRRMASDRFPSRDHEGLVEPVKRFLSRSGIAVRRAGFGVAGPVVDGRARITNLPWVLEEKSLADALNLSSVRLANDLLAFACAVPLLGPDDLFTVNPGRPDPKGAIAVVAPGTGLGEAFLVWTGSHYQPCPSEGGHADFAPGDPLEAALLSDLKNQFGHVSWERVCSGMGIGLIFEHLSQKPGAPAVPIPPSNPDPVPAIVAAALDPDRPCPVCRATLDTFIRILGAEAGNMALKVMATGGVYLGGGLPPRLLEWLSRGPFMAAFSSKGRMSDLMSRMPVHVVVNPEAALMGAALMASASDGGR